MIQGYGKFLGYEFEDEDFTSAELDIAVQERKLELMKMEKPIKICETSERLIENLKSGNFIYLTSGSIKKFVLEDEDNQP